MSSNQQLVDRLFEMTALGETDTSAFRYLDELVYSRLGHTYADDEAFEAGIQVAESVDLSAIDRAA